MDAKALAVILTNLYLTVPQCLGAGLCVLILLKPRISARILRLVIYSLAYALFCSLTFYLAINYSLLTPRVLLLIAFDYMLFRCLFGFEPPLAQVAAVISTLALVITTLAGTLVATLLATISGNYFADFYTMKPSLGSALIWYPCYALMPLLIWRWREYIGQRCWRVVEVLFKYPKAQAVLWLIIIQLALLGGGFMNIANHLATDFHSLLLVLGLAGFVVLLLSTLIVSYLSLEMARKLHERSLENNLNQHTDDLLSTVETQREGFIGALDKLDSLAEQGINPELGALLDSVADDLEQVNRRLMAGNTLISAILNAKLIQSEKSGIKMEIDLQAPLNGPVIEKYTLEMVRILGNLLDNALDAVQDLQPAQKWVRIQSQHAEPLHYVKISNPLPDNAALSERVFEPGYSGKGGSHSGLGLYIARTLASQLGGQLKFQIEPGPVLSFVLVLPK